MMVTEWLLRTVNPGLHVLIVGLLVNYLQLAAISHEVPILVPRLYLGSN